MSPDVRFALREVRDWSLSLAAVVVMVAIPALLGGPAWLSWPVTVLAAGLILLALFGSARRLEGRRQKVHVRID